MQSGLCKISDAPRLHAMVIGMLMPGVVLMLLFFFRLAYRNLDPRFGLRIATVRPRAFAYVTDRTGRTRWVVEYDDGGRG